MANRHKVSKLAPNSHFG